VAVGVPVGVLAGVGVRVEVGTNVRVGMLVGVATTQGDRLVTRRPQALRLPVSRAARSLIVSVQVPLPFCPVKADSGLVGLNAALGAGGHVAPMICPAPSSRVRPL